MHALAWTAEAFDAMNEEVSGPMLSIAGHAAASLFEEGGSILDIGCATAPISRNLWKHGSYSALTLVDSDYALLSAARRACPGSRAIWGDMMRVRLPSAHYGLLTNVTALLNAGEVKHLLSRIPVGLLLVNFMVQEDQAPGRAFFYRMDPSIRFQPIPEQELERIIEETGWYVERVTRYTDTKPERMMVLRRD